MGIVFAILIFSFLIFIHELGHFVAAKLSGVQVNEFSMFMGPAIFKKKKGDTLYAIRCIPIGGYCAMEGEDTDTESPHSFRKATWWKRLIILAAGSVMNFIAGFLLFAIFLSCTSPTYATSQIKQFDDCSTIYGENLLQPGDELLEIDGEKIYVLNDFNLIMTVNGDQQTHHVVVKRDGKRVDLGQISLTPHNHPMIAGLEECFTTSSNAVFQPNDIIQEINGRYIYSLDDFHQALADAEGDSLVITVSRDGKQITLLNFRLNKHTHTNEDGTSTSHYGIAFHGEDGSGYSHYGMAFESEEKTVWSTIRVTWLNSVDTVRSVRLSLQMLFNGKAGLNDVAGPVGIVHQMNNVANASPTWVDALLNMLYFGAFIAINLAVMNMLPIPALDGGRIFALIITLIIEKITRKKLNPKYEGYIHGVGMVLLLALMALILFKDVFTIFKG